MLRLGLFALVLSASTLQAQAQTRQELDIKQAKLTDKSKALDEISISFGQYVILRDQTLNGTDGFYSQSKQWFADASAFMTAWNPLLIALDGSRLASDEEAAKATQLLSQQLTTLKNLLERQRLILRKGQVTSQQLAAIQRIKPSRVAEFAPSAAAFNQQLDIVQEESNKAMAIFSEQLGSSLQALADQLDRLLTLKLQKLALEYPELKAKLKEVEQTLIGIKLVDVEVARLVSLDANLQQAFNKGRVFAAAEQHEQLKKAAAETMASIQAQKQLTEGVKANAVTRIQSILSSRENDLKMALGLLTQKQRFISYYRAEVIHPLTGMVRKCKATPQPKNIDCALLRSIVFQEAQLTTLNEEQLAYLEKTIDRVKEGPVSSVDTLQGAKP